MAGKPATSQPIVVGTNENQATQQEGREAGLAFTVATTTLR